MVPKSDKSLCTDAPLPSTKDWGERRLCHAAVNLVPVYICITFFSLWQLKRCWQTNKTLAQHIRRFPLTDFFKWRGRLYTGQSDAILPLTAISDGSFISSRLRFVDTDLPLWSEMRLKSSTCNWCFLSRFSSASGLLLFYLLARRVH